MRIESHRFGVIEVPEDHLLRFVRPVIGFPEHERYALVEAADTAPVLWLQAAGAREVLFPVVAAAWVPAATGVGISDEEATALGLEEAEEARLLFILTLQPDPAAITLNLRAPIVWNTRRGTAMQVVLQDSELPVSYPIGAGAGERRSNKEVACARPYPP